MTKITCPICADGSVRHFAKANDVEYFTSGRRFDFYRCDSCDILFIYPMLSDRLNEIYPSNYYSFHANAADTLALRFKKRLDDRAFQAITKQLNGERLSALDVGGGIGWLLDGLKRADSRIADTTVVDIDAGAADVARAKGHNFHLTPIEGFETEKTFDLILMLNLIEHVPDPIQILKKAKSLLSPGGLIWIKTPNYDSLDARIFRYRSWGGYHTPRHFVLFTKPSFIRHCESAGLHVLNCSYTQGAPFWTVSAINELKRVGLAEVSAARPSLQNSLTPFFHLLFAAFDFVRMPFSKTSQMNCILTAQSSTSETSSATPISRAKLGSSRISGGA